MKFILLALLSILTFTVSGQQAIAFEQKHPQDFFYKKISKEQIEVDFRCWLETMEASHVNLYHTISKSQLSSLFNDLLKKYSDSLSHTETVFLFSRLSAALNEGHLGLVSSRITDSLYNNSLRFPFMIRKVEKDGWHISYDLSQAQQLDMNDRIIRINGISVEELNKRYLQLFGGLDTWKHEQIGFYSRKLLFLDGVHSPFHIEAVKENGEKRSFTVPGFPRSQADSINRVLSAKMNSQGNKPYEFRFLPEGIGYMNYRSMRNDRSEPFEKFLDETFARLNDSSAKGLIIDLRENGGGDSQLGELLLRYFNRKPYIFAGGMKWKISAPYKTFLKGQANYNEADNRFYMSQKDGETYVYINKELKKPEAKEPFFSGKVAFLIGTGTFSSANMLADGVVSYQLARTFGEPTGESPNDFGEMYNFMLPNSYVIARGSTKMFTRANKDEKDFGPVIPDVIVRPTAADLKLKKDRVLESAVNWVLNK
ncbi:MAG TPA: hypothetical protein DHW64_07320 [Chitinophagaceae bacterium]|nr:hypothetical protein [Chitinophagaceae bacterium]